MSDDEFDPSAAAARAVGDLADEDVGGGTGGGDPDPASTASDEGGSPESLDDSDSTEGDGGGAAGVLASFVVPLFVADERGPSSSTFQDFDVPEGLSLILDGLTDYVLDLAGKDVGDSLGPAGKIGLGYSRLAGGGSSTEGDGGERDDRDDEQGDGGGAPDLDADVGGV